MSTARASLVASRFLDALSRRDYDDLAATFRTNARLRGLVPSTLREAEGPGAIAERFRFWNGDADTDGWELLESDFEEFADVIKLHWRVAAIDPEDGRTVNEQTAYAEIDETGIVWMNLVCSGHRPARS
jgi:hypothetical protein